MGVTSPLRPEEAEFRAEFQSSQVAFPGPHSCKQRGLDSNPDAADFKARVLCASTTYHCVALCVVGNQGVGALEFVVILLQSSWQT